MEQLLVEDLIYYKVLPYTIYDESEEVLYTKGETLTPEMILELRKLPVVFRRKVSMSISPSSTKPIKTAKEMFNQTLPNKTIIEKIDFTRSVENLPYSFIDNVDINNYSGPLNKEAKFDFPTQIKIKTVFINAIDFFKQGETGKALELFSEIRNKINEELHLFSNEIVRCSQLLFLGEYNYCHMLNCAMLATALAIKLGYQKLNVSDITMAALLHDLGKLRLSKEQSIKEHSFLSYKIVKDEFKLSPVIANAILGHHENNDGSGYPKGVSSEQISVVSNIINICSTYDNLLFNRTPLKINSNREALREMLNIGTSVFLPDLFYTFIHMFSYNDVTPLEEMIFE